jgi:hypothetical protein
MTDRPAPDQAEASDAARPRKIRSRLFLKYAGLFVGVVCVALVTNACSRYGSPTENIKTH